MGTVPLQFRILDELVTIDVTPPSASMRLDEVLPVVRALDDQFSTAAVRRNGVPVTCARGCSACCRIQAVPVTPAEAYALLLLVENLAEPWRAEVLSRFSDRAARLRSAGLAEGFLEGHRPAGGQEAKAQAQQYLDLGLVCPFLQDDACGIYQVRPYACREYFVTSAKELCADPLSLPVQTVPVAPSAIDVDLSTAAQVTGRPAYAIPLTLALDFAQAHRDELERSYNGQQLFTSSIGNFFRLASMKA